MESIAGIGQTFFTSGTTPAFSWHAIQFRNAFVDRPQSDRFCNSVLPGISQPKAFARDVQFAANSLHALRNRRLDLVVRHREGDAFGHGLFAHERFGMRSECDSACIETRSILAN